MTFALSISKFAAKTAAGLDRAVKTVVIDLATNIIMRSPVDTGRFRGNWQHGVGTIPTGNLDTVDPSGAATISAITASVHNTATGTTHYLANNLPYGQRLEYDSWSKQAPSGMVRISVLEFQTMFPAVYRSGR